MKFKIIRARKGFPDQEEPNSCLLRVDYWNDFSFQTLFDLQYYDDSGAGKAIGSIKIMEKGQTTENRVQLPGDEFETLDEKYCSLGQGQPYYEELMSLPTNIRKDILVSLRDCVHDMDIYNEFKDELAMQTSLMRFVSVSNMKKFRDILLDRSVLTPYHFRYKLKSNPDCVLNVEVVPDSKPPTNVHVVIGGNGVGKTSLLSGIADELTNNDDPGKRMSIPGEIYFLSEIDNNGHFANLVTVAFSVFDNFSPIKPQYVKGSIKYHYVGLKRFLTKNQTKEVLRFKNMNNLRSEFKSSLKVCLESQRKIRWVDAIKILNSDLLFAEYQLHDVANNEDTEKAIEQISKIFGLLSSGHKIILLSITKLVELVDERTLVLIDEPESHLHPPLLASFTRAISDLLIKRNGVAIIATHSPVVLQEVPSSCVTIISRAHSEFHFYHTDIETFAENVGTLTRESFKLEVTQSGFHKMIVDFLKDHSYDELITEFDNQVGSEGKAIARSFLITNSDNNA